MEIWDSLASHLGVHLPRDAFSALMLPPTCPLVDLGAMHAACSASSSTHHEFLSFIKPVYYLRPRSYSLSLSRPPFLIAYQGVLFRKV